MKKVPLLIIASLFSVVSFAQNWSLSGNSGTNPSSNFIGTTDNQPLIFKSNNQVVGYFNNTNTILGWNPYIYNLATNTAQPGGPLWNMKGSTLLGQQVGQGSTNLTNCIGISSGGSYNLYNSSNCSSYIAIGDGAGQFASNVTNSISMGSGSGYSANTINNGITLGANTSFIASNSLNIGNLLFGTGITSTNYSSPAGNIGIGTSSPYAKLHVVTSGTPLSVPNFPYTGDMIIQANNATGRSTTSGASLEFVIPANIDPTGANPNPWGQARIMAVAANQNNGDATGKMVLGTRRNVSGAWVYGNDVTIDGSGNVGIGTTSPQAKLDVAGNINAVGQSLFTYNAPFSDPAPGVPNAIKANGGISTSNGQSVFSLVNFSDPVVGTSYAVKVGGGGIAINGTSVFNDNVGIGTNAPSTKLEVKSDAANTSGLRLTGLTSTSPVATVPTATLGVDDNGNVVTVAGSVSPVAQVNYMPSYRGNISANTMTNVFNLPVNTHYGDGTGAGILDMITDDADGGGGFGLIGGNRTPFVSSPVVWLYSNQVNAFTVAIKNHYTSGHPELAGENMLPALQVRETGLIGINTTSPQARLDISGNIRINDGTQAAGKVLTCDANGVASWQPVGAGTGGTTYPAGANKQVQFNSNGSFAANGNFAWDNDNASLSIGQLSTVSSPAKYALNVNGFIRADKLTVNTTGADFVFEPGYKLRPLAEVEGYVKENKHLPGIATAADMQKDGLEIGDSQTKLLQKIEELTLYIIQQEKRIEKLESGSKKQRRGHK